MASLLWAFSFGLIKGQLGGIDPVLLAFLRLTVSAVVFLPWVLRHRLAGGIVRRAMALGAIQFGLMYVLYIASYQYLPAYAVALMTVFTPLYVVAMVDLLERRFVWRHLSAALLAVAGAALITARGFAGPEAWLGILLLQGANLCFASGQVLYRRLAAPDAPRIGSATGAGPRPSEAALLGWMYIGAALLTGLAIAAIMTIRGLEVGRGLNSAAWLVIMYLGLLPTAAGFYLWNKGAIRVNAGILAVGNNLKVPLAILVSWFVFGEEADYLRVLVGLALILIALFWAARPTSTKE